MISLSVSLCTQIELEELLHMVAYKRLDTSKRIKIQTMLEQHQSFKRIAAELGVHPSTISREIQNGSVEHNVRGLGSINRCAMRQTCDKHNLCPGQSYLCRKKKCSTCHKVNCNIACKEYEEYHCPQLDKPPYVCNGCEKRRACAYRKRMYFADHADSMSMKLRSESRSGIVERQII